MLGGRKKLCVICGKEIKIGHMRKVCGPICNAKRKKNKDKVAIKSAGGRTIQIGKEQAKKRAWTAFSAYIRHRGGDGKYNTCYTCGRRMEIASLQAGHAIGGRLGVVLFDEEICRPQCVGCNIFKRGMYQEFITKLVNENGLDWWNKKYAESKFIKKYSIQDYLDVESKYRNILEGMIGVQESEPRE